MAAAIQALACEADFTGTRGDLYELLDRRVAASVAAQEAAQQRRDDVEAARWAGEVKRLRAQAQQLRRDEMPLIERDARALPDDYGLQYRYAMSVYLNQRIDDAIAVLERAHSLQPQAENALYMLVLMRQKQQRWGEAQSWCDKLIRLRPDHPDYHAVYRQLQR